MHELRRQARSRLVYVVFHVDTKNKQDSVTSFRLELSFLINSRGRYFGRYIFDSCVLSIKPTKYEITSFNERRWLCAMVPATSQIRYNCYACSCQCNLNLSYASGDYESGEIDISA